MTWSSFLFRKESFVCNFCWSSYVGYIDGWIPKMSMSVPILGYLLLFNDQISEMLIFKGLANEGSLDFGLSSVVRLRLLYFGLIFLGVGNLAYRIRKPFVFKMGVNSHDYQKACFGIFIWQDYSLIKDELKRKCEVSQVLKEQLDKWDDFSKQALGNSITHDRGWNEVKNYFGDMLLTLLECNYKLYDRGRRKSLALCLLSSTVGYLMLALPSLDLFWKVLCTFK